MERGGEEKNNKTSKRLLFSRGWKTLELICGTGSPRNVKKFLLLPSSRTVCSPTGLGHMLPLCPGQRLFFFYPQTKRKSVQECACVFVYYSPFLCLFIPRNKYHHGWRFFLSLSFNDTRRPNHTHWVPVQYNLFIFFCFSNRIGKRPQNWCEPILAREFDRRKLEGKVPRSRTCIVIIISTCNCVLYCWPNRILRPNNNVRTQHTTITTTRICFLVSYVWNLESKCGWMDGLTFG